MTLTIALAETPDDLDAVRGFCSDMRASVVARAKDPDIVESLYPADGFEALLRDLPVIHARPKGAILLARKNGMPVGCAMYLPAGPGAAEVKRMYVSEAARGSGAGRGLCAALIDLAQADGYERLVLDTGPQNHAALGLYDAMGFVRVPAPANAPPALVPVAVFMERAL